jgi:hypothetical protein
VARHSLGLWRRNISSAPIAQLAVDARCGLRQLHWSPVFSPIAVAILALRICAVPLGAQTADAVPSEVA